MPPAEVRVSGGVPTADLQVQFPEGHVAVVRVRGLLHKVKGGALEELVLPESRRALVVVLLHRADPLHFDALQAVRKWRGVHLRTP